MIAAVEALVLLFVLIFAVLVYRWLIHSPSFTRLVGGVIDPSPETDREVINRLDDAEAIAERRAEEADRTAASQRRTAETIRRRTSKSQ
jgi:hypothetical protein